MPSREVPKGCSDSGTTVDLTAPSANSALTLNKAFFCHSAVAGIRPYHRAFAAYAPFGSARAFDGLAGPFRFRKELLVTKKGYSLGGTDAASLVQL